MATQEASPKKETPTAASTAATPAPAEQPAVPKWKLILGAVLEKLRRKPEASGEAPRRREGLVTDIFWMFRRGNSSERKMASLFLGSLLGIAVLLSWSAVSYYQSWKKSELEDMRGKELDAFFTRQARETDIKDRTANLGEFVFDLRKDESLVGNSHASNTAQVQIFVECDTKETCSRIIARSTHLRDKISLALTMIDRDDLMSHEGKGRIQDQLKDEINTWLGNGKVTQLYFDELILD